MSSIEQQRELSIEKTTWIIKRRVLMPAHSSKTSAIRTVAISMPRVAFLERAKV